MRPALALFLSLWLPACAVAATTERPRVVPRPPRSGCTLQNEQLLCADRMIDLRTLGLALPIRALAPRRLGGVFVVDAQGQLLRIDQSGQATGHERGDYLAVRAVGPLVCTLDASGDLACLVDRHDERACGVEDALPPLFLAARSLGVTFAASPRPDQLCAQRGAEGNEDVVRCVTLNRPCERTCLRFPSCHAPLRCIDACLPGQLPLVGEPVSNDFYAPSSAMAQPEVTHEHGRAQGGYAAAGAQP